MLLTSQKISYLLKQAYDPLVGPESPYPTDKLKSQPIPAAVLITFLQKDKSWHLLFIRRTVKPYDRHSGQVAYPGGRCASTDPNIESAALREAQEEVGLDPDDVLILGRIRDMLTITNYRITPIVGLLPWPYHFTPQAEEVDHIFTIPLNWLADPCNRKVRKRGLQLLGKDVPVVYFQKYDGELLWGASARITLLLLEALNLSLPENRYTSLQ